VEIGEYSVCIITSALGDGRPCWFASKFALINYCTRIIMMYICVYDCANVSLSVYMYNFQFVLVFTVNALQIMRP